MKNKRGACRFCGQQKIIEVPETLEQEEIDEEVTLECRCAEARGYQEKREREEKTQAQMVSAKGTVYELFHEEFPEIEDVLNECIPLLVNLKARKILVNTGKKVTASVSISKGTIKVERVEKSVYSRETDLE